MSQPVLIFEVIDQSATLPLIRKRAACNTFESALPSADFVATSDKHTLIILIMNAVRCRCDLPSYAKTQLGKAEMTPDFQNLPVLTTNQMIEVDRLMIEEWGINLFQMMENAGRNLAELARRQLGGIIKGPRIAVLCGNGNNGGGGMTAARHLHNWGAQVEVFLAGDELRLKEIPAHQWRILKKMGIGYTNVELSGNNLIVDAMLGYGAMGNPRSPIAEWIQRANESEIPIVSLDAPSGLDTTTGIPGSPCIDASATLTLALPKTGLLAPTAKQFVGDLYLADIGVPPELYTAPSLRLHVISPFAEDTIVKLP